MNNLNDLISRAAAIKAFAGKPPEYYSTEYICDVLNELPTIAAIPVEWLQKKRKYASEGDSLDVGIAEVLDMWEKKQEAVYPTWLEWLESLGFGIAYRDGYDINGVEGWAFSFNEAEKHIPADIAQKLGIKPKEK